MSNKRVKRILRRFGLRAIYVREELDEAA